MQRRIYFCLLGLVFLMGLAFYLLSGLWFETSVAALAALAASGFVSRFAAGGFIRSLEGLEKDDASVYVYDEFVPYVKKVNRVRDEMKLRIDTLAFRLDIIESVTMHMDEGLLLLDRHGNIRIANKRAAGMFGLDTGRENILHICRDAEFQSGIRACLDGTRSETRLERAGRVYSVFADPVKDGNGPAGGAVLFFDITAGLAAEKQRREFSANVSHELRTPLTAILGLAEMLSGGVVADEDVAVFAAKLHNRAEGLMDIIRDIIRLSEFDEGADLGEFEEFDLGELINSAVSSFKARAEEKNVKITAEAESVKVKSDRRLMETLLGNLIENAVKYNKDGGSVVVTAEGGANGWQLCVADTGTGIPAEDLHRVFERFYRVDKSGNKKTGGTGLGLSIVKHIMERLGGHVEIESKAGEGTAVRCSVSV